MQIPLNHAEVADQPRSENDSDRDDGTHEIAPDLAYKRLMLVNVAMSGVPGAGDGKWVLIDAGIPGMTNAILKSASERFSAGSRPSAIILTHGHFDHVGSLLKLLGEWDVPVYAHQLEFPYLNGTAKYPAADPMVGGGLLSMLSLAFPRGPIDIKQWLRPLPADGSVPGMPGWTWLHTPGHTPGHISLWREKDKTIIAGDAFITTAQESAYAVATQSPEMHGPPMYFTQNWQHAQTSVEKLAALQPEVVVTGHGPAMRGADMRGALNALASSFKTIAIPAEGHYNLHPATTEDGSAYEAVNA